ncbi:hypothetical protein LTR37_010467 [Vermiconidia calcicola]|uniref:Uncharacterized protein n=1 Tax=Vermiconidia calcicola TaxID=1690605 RepID=A0ACC3N514_9PEZI|nr:hypothetical protein LTR37_010467 [Vermiconidia calcicola]
MAVHTSSSYVAPFELRPYDEYDAWYTALVRKNLGSFHKNLSKGKYAANALLNAPDVHWNYDGTLIVSREAAIAALKGQAEGSFSGVQARDVYTIVDGHLGSTLYRLQGTQSGPFAGLPVQPDGDFNAYGAELFVFDTEALLTDLTTVDRIGIIKAQMAGEAKVPLVEVEKASNPQTSPEYRAMLRQNIAKLHDNVIAGKPGANAVLAAEEVIVEDNGSISNAEKAGHGAFPIKSFHDDYILADGKQGVVEYVWQAAQESEYMGLHPKEGAQVRMRGFLFFEFDDQGLVTKVVGIHDEFVVAAQLEGGFLYP